MLNASRLVYQNRNVSNKTKSEPTFGNMPLVEEDYSEKYIKYLVEAISNNEVNPDKLNDIERIKITEYLKKISDDKITQ